MKINITRSAGGSVQIIEIEGTLEEVLNTPNEMGELAPNEDDQLPGETLQ